MTKKRKTGKNRKNFVAIPFSGQLVLSTLVTDIVILGSMLSSSFAEDIFIISVDCLWAIRGHTAGQTPLEFGIAHGDLTVTEISECLNSELTDPNDIIQRERGRRPVRRVGTFGGSLADPVYNDGRKMKTTCKFSLSNGNSLNAYLLNNSGVTLTTGAVLEFSGTIYGRWQR